MNGPVPSPAPEPGAVDRPNPLDGFRELKLASLFGLIGQVLIWGSAIALWIVGTVYSNIPASTSIAYGVHGISVSARAVFDLNAVLILGAVVALFSFVLSTRSFQTVAKAGAPVNVGLVAPLTTLGAVGLGMFALGWTVWLGSFVPPGSPITGDNFAYDPVLAPNLGIVVGLLLVLGGFLAFLGMIGIAWGSSKLGTTYEEGAIEMGGVLTVLPVFSVLGYALSVVGLLRGERKLGRGWTPPPPPPPPTYLSAIYPPGTPIVVSGRQGGWDSLAVVLVVLLVLLWLIILPFALFIATSGFVHGPANVPQPPGNSSAPASAGPSSVANPSTAVPLLLLALGATAVILPLAIVRNRRKRQRPSPAAATPPPPPPPPRPPVERGDDPLDHLV